MKSLAKKIIVAILGWQIRRLRKRNDFTIVAVAGSVGKTSAKLHIAEFLAQEKRVCWQDGNYNDLVSVPLIFFNQKMPSLLNPIAWIITLIKTETKVHKIFPYEVVVVELGTDGIGQLSQFSSYISPDIAVVTAVQPEHMEFFDTMLNVAKEELSIAKFCGSLFVSTDFIDKEYLDLIDRPYKTFGTNAKDDVRLVYAQWDSQKLGYDIEVATQNHKIKAFAKMLGEHQLQTLLPAIGISSILGLSESSITKAINKARPFAGRMQILEGVNNSLIIDDSYNASPSAVKSALDLLYKLKVSGKYAILGNMNELGDESRKSHQEIGKYCDPNQLDMVLTLGKDANKYLAEEATKKGCKVEKFDDPYSLGNYLKSNIKNGSAILAKGSQNGVFAEEAVKQLLNNKSDEDKLVRQSKSWLKTKNKQFKN